jgi:hypothetical protein
MWKTINALNRLATVIFGGGGFVSVRRPADVSIQHDFGSRPNRYDSYFVAVVAVVVVDDDDDVRVQQIV